MDQTLRRVAVIGGVRIPFCRSNTFYADQSNLEMLTATLNGLVDKYDLKGVHIDEAIGGAVVSHSKDWNLAREAVLGTKLAPTTPGITIQQACGTSLQAAAMIGAKIATGETESGIAMGSDTTSDAPDRVQAEVRAPPGRGAERQVDGRPSQGLQGLLAVASWRRSRPIRRRAAHGPLHGPARRADGAGVEDLPRRAGPARLREPQEGGRGLPLRLHGRPRRAVRRRVPRQQPARGHLASRRSRSSRPPSTSPSAARSPPPTRRR